MKIHAHSQRLFIGASCPDCGCARPVVEGLARISGRAAMRLRRLDVCGVRMAAAWLGLVGLTLGMSGIAAEETAAPRPPAKAPAWVNVTNDLGGDAPTWGFSTITLGVAPGTDNVYAHIGNKVGLFVTRDGGGHWAKLAGPAENMGGNVSCMLFDPKDPKTFWICCWYGRGLVKTTDEGKTFQSSRTSGSYDEYLTLDFRDPERKTMVIAKHEGVGDMALSKDGGVTRTAIGRNLLKGSPTRWPLLLGSETILTAGIPEKPATGILRSDDAGNTWTRVFDLTPTRAPTLTSKGTVFYPVKDGLARSSDAGKSWVLLKCPVKGSIIELPDGRLAGLGANIFLSDDNGDSWTAFGPNLPVWPSSWGPSLVYLPGRKAFMLCSMAWNKKIPNAVWRLDIPQEKDP